MSHTVQAPGSAPVAQPNHVDLGTPPLALSSLLLLGVGLGGLLFLVAIGASGQGGVILAVCLFIPWLVITGVIGIGFLTILLGGGARNFSRTRAAVREGRVGVSYHVRSWIGDNIVVVDEAQRLLCLNGDIIGFDAVRKLGWQSDKDENKLEFVLSSGANPVRTVNLASQARMKAAFERLCNTLGFSS